MKRDKKQILIFGTSYTGGFLTETLEKDYEIYQTSRKPENANQIDFYNLDLIKKHINEAEVILSTVPNDKEIDPVLYRYEESIKKSNAKWIGYLSSTSVYGNHDGCWVKENSNCKPHDDNSSNRLLIEKKWHNLFYNHEKPIHIFRLAGIYGPNRNPIERIKKGKNFTIIKDMHFFSRIHVEDICRILKASIEKPNSGAIYNVCDEEPCPNNKVEQFAAKLLNIPKLKEISYYDFKKNASERLIKFYESNRKVDSRKVLSELGIKLKYPNYREGLKEGCSKQYLL